LRLFGHLERLLDQRAQLLQRHRLRKVVERARLERRHRVFGAAMRGDHRDRNVQRLVGDVLDDLQPFTVGQAHVGEAKVEAVLVEQPNRIADGFCAGGIQSHSGKRHLKQFQQIRLVVDDEHARLAAQFAGHVSPLVGSWGPARRHV
jgi:hypothetical protein